MHMFVYIDLLQPGPKNEVISVCEPDNAVEEPLKESAAPTDMLQSSEVASSHQLLSHLDLEQPVTASLLLEFASYVQQPHFDICCNVTHQYAYIC